MPESMLSPSQAKSRQRKRQRERGRQQLRDQRRALTQALDALAALDRTTQAFMAGGAPQPVDYVRLERAREQAADAVVAISPMIH